MKRPARVRVLGKPFTLDYVPEGHEGLLNDAGEASLGMCMSGKQRIYVEDGQPLETEQEITLHEVMHAVEAAMGLDVEDEVIERLSTGLLAVFKDNPTFVRYLTSKPARVAA